MCVCLCVYICVYVFYVCMCVCVCMCLCVYVCARVCVCAHQEVQYCTYFCAKNSKEVTTYKKAMFTYIHPCLVVMCSSIATCMYQQLQLQAFCDRVNNHLVTKDLSFLCEQMGHNLHDLSAVHRSHYIYCDVFANTKWFYLPRRFSCPGD